MAHHVPLQSQIDCASHAATSPNASQRAVGRPWFDPTGPTLATPILQLPVGEEFARASRDLVNAFEEHERAATSLQRLRVAAPFVHDDRARRAALLAAAAADGEPPPPGPGGRGGGGGKRANAEPAAAAAAPRHQLTPSEAFAAAPLRLREELEVTYTDEAEMVFTTLSSSGRGVFAKLQRGFPLVGLRIARG